MKIKKFFSRLCLVQYRLTTISRGKTTHTYCTSKKMLKGILREMRGVDYWAIYKTGPLGLFERLVDYKYD